MKMIQSINIKTVLLAFVIILAGVGCKKDEPVVAVTENFDTKFAANSELSLFQYALKKAKLTSFTQGPGPYTIFAPTNAAFNTFGITNEATINSIDSNALVQLLTFHIQTGVRTYVEIPFGPNAPMVTQGGLTQYATRYNGGSAYINGAKITTQDVVVSNGLFHIIDKVLQAPAFNALSVLSSSPNYTRMAQAISKAGATTSAVLTAFTTGTGTFFAVPNNAMVAAGYDSTTIANLTGTPLTLLGNIMRYHVITQRIFPQDFKNANYRTSQSANVGVTVAGSTVNIKGVTNPTPFQIISPSFTCTNGVLYGINGLLKY